MKWKHMTYIWIAAAVAGGMAAAPFWLSGAAGTVIRGVSADGIDVSGMTGEELAHLIEEKNRKIAGRSLTLRHGSLERTWQYADFSVRMDTERETERLLRLGRSGRWTEDFLTRWGALLGGDHERLSISYDKEKAAGAVAALAADYEKPPESSHPVIHDDGSVSFSGARPYIEIDREALSAAVDAMFLSGGSGVVELPVLSEKGASVLTEDQQREVNRVLGSCTTYFGPSPNRSENIRRAAARIDGWFLMPGDGFSFNQATGLRTRENGYLDAPVFIDGKLVPDAGGGVCQVSTTLFNAVLYAGLAVTERTCHFAPVSYVPIGQDATVADNYLDFRFVNSRAHPVYIYAVYEPGALTVYILGNEADAPASVSLAETERKTLPHTIAFTLNPSQTEDLVMEEGNDGCDVTVNREVLFRDGSRFSDSFRSVYDAVDTVYAYRTKQLLEKDRKKWEKASADKEKKRAAAQKKQAAAEKRAGNTPDAGAAGQVDKEDIHGEVPSPLPE